MVGVYARRGLALSFLAATVGVCIAAQSQPTRTPKQGVAKGESGFSAQKSETPSKEPSNSPNVPVVIKQEEPANKESHKNEADENIDIQRKLATYTGLLVFAGFVTAFVVGWQAYESMRAAKAAEQSIRLQAVQWVALKNWRGELIDPYVLRIKVDIFNETNFPLTLNGTEFRIGAAAASGPEDIRVIPHAKHSVGFLHQFMEQEYANYREGVTIFGIRGAIRFTGLNGKQVQSFGGLITASLHNGISFESITEYEQSAKEHYGEGTAN